MVMDSGAVKTIVPRRTIPGMKVEITKDTGKNFRAANGGLIPNEGQTKIKGKTRAGDLKLIAQVAETTKPLAAASEIVDAGNWIILNKKGGIIKGITNEVGKEIMELLKKNKGPVVPIKRKNNQFVMELWVPQEDGWSNPSKYTTHHAERARRCVTQ